MPSQPHKNKRPGTPGGAAPPRAHPLLTVELGQINRTRLHLWKTKTDAPRTVPMSDEIAALLVDLLKTGTMPTERSLRSWWERAKAAMGLEDDGLFVFHVCRHTCATRLLDEGVNPIIIQQWLGHKRIETTLRYAHVKPKNLEEALVKVGDARRKRQKDWQFSGVFCPQTLPHRWGNRPQKEA